MATESQTRIDAIRKSVDEYHKHKNDPYAYYLREIDAVRGLESHALEDIEFLLAQLNHKSQ